MSILRVNRANAGTQALTSETRAPINSIVKSVDAVRPDDGQPLQGLAGAATSVRVADDTRGGAGAVFQKPYLRIWSGFHDGPVHGEDKMRAERDHIPLDISEFPN